MKHRQQAQHQQQGKTTQQAGAVQMCPLGEGHLQHPVPAGHSAHCHGGQGEQDMGEEGEEEVLGGQGEPGAQKQVLRVAHRGGHAAKVGGHSLEHHHGNYPLLTAGKLQNEQGEGDKGDEGHIIGDEHGGEEGEEHQQQAEQAQAFTP